MVSASEQSELSEEIRQNRLVLFAEIIRALAGDKSNLKVKLQEIKFNIGKAKVELDGEVDFNLVYAEASETKNYT